MWFFIFFFQAEDGIRDADVTGVQKCALPISDEPLRNPRRGEPHDARRLSARRASSSIARAAARGSAASRSEERRVGKEWGARRARQEETEREYVERAHTSAVRRTCRRRRLYL